jgi:mono/diheme cytochrome c family protein
VWRKRAIEEATGMSESGSRHERAAAGTARRRRVKTGAAACVSAVLGALVVLAAALAQLGAPLSAPSDTSVAAVTYSRDVAPILRNRCVECHREGGLAAFSLTSYDDARDNAPLIRGVAENRLMPPWKAAAGYGEFINDPSLTQEEIDAIGKWVDAGTPEGNPEDLPPPRELPKGWRLGTPDLVLDPGADFPVRAKEGDLYRSFVLPFKPDEDVWISAIEVSPGDSAVVHHLGLIIDPKGKSPALDRASPGLGFPGGPGFMPNIVLAFWTPGNTPRFLDPGTAWRIPAKSNLVLDIHYRTDGRPHLDRTRIGLYYAKGPIDKRVRFGAVGNSTFAIPPGAKRHEVTSRRRIPRDIHLVSGWPHMHYLGREMKVWAVLPGGENAPVVWVPDFDTHWQSVYILKNPLSLPAGSYVELEAFYDNSADNPLNPRRKPKTVYYGQRARDEMCFFYFNYTVDDESLTEGRAVGFDGIELSVGMAE